ncbi:hypothetical protein H9P43_006162 [Blastocladiella emersonii ATCC 22665]|nr:hypothetical protein H9P43_006162 [Blastocladiella emersonii ATCC 22665]
METPRPTPSPSPAAMPPMPPAYASAPPSQPATEPPLASIEDLYAEATAAAGGGAPVVARRGPPGALERSRILMNNSAARQAHQNMAALRASRWTTANGSTRLMVVFDTLLTVASLAVSLVAVAFALRPDGTTGRVPSEACTSLFKFELAALAHGVVAMAVLPVRARVKLARSSPGGGGYKEMLQLARFGLIVVGVLILWPAPDECSVSLTVGKLAWAWIGLAVAQYGVVLVILLAVTFAVPFVLLALFWNWIGRRIFRSSSNPSDSTNPANRGDGSTPRGASSAVQYLHLGVYQPTKLDHLPPLDVPADRAMCVICLDDYAPDVELARLPCAHVFHRECVTQWLGVATACPMCKRDVERTAIANGQVPTGHEHHQQPLEGIASSSSPPVSSAAIDVPLMAASSVPPPPPPPVPAMPASLG